MIVEVKSAFASNDDKSLGSSVARETKQHNKESSTLSPFPASAARSRSQISPIRPAARVFRQNSWSQSFETISKAEFLRTLSADDGISPSNKYPISSMNRRDSPFERRSVIEKSGLYKPIPVEVVSSSLVPGCRKGG